MNNFKTHRVAPPSLEMMMLVVARQNTKKEKLHRVGNCWGRSAWRLVEAMKSAHSSSTRRGVVNLPGN